MLGNCPIEVVLLATDLKASRDFYVQKIGLEQTSPRPSLHIPFLPFGRKPCQDNRGELCSGLGRNVDQGTIDVL